MRVATVRSRCECQASLVAVLNESHHVVSAYTVGREKEREDAPAHTMGSQNERFDVGWLCNICGRNVLRSFSASALAWVEVPTAPVNPAAAEALAAAAAKLSLSGGARRGARRVMRGRLVREAWLGSFGL
jgi:hypothetical protein